MSYIRYIKTCFALLPGLAMLVFTGCNKDFEWELPLAVNNEYIELEQEGDRTRIMVYSTGKWTATLEDGIDWAYLTEAEGEGIGVFVFRYEDNPTITRQAIVTIRGEGHEVQIKVNQKGLMTEAELFLEKAGVELISTADSVTVGFQTNMGEALYRIVPVVEYEDRDEGGWISAITLSDTTLHFKYADNTGTTRNATITLMVEDRANDNIYSVSLTVNQGTAKASMSFPENPVVYQFFQRKNTAVFLNNLQDISESIDISVNYAGTHRDWITDITPGDGELSFFLLGNEETATRYADITLSYTDSQGATTKATLSVEQTGESGGMNFADLRAMIPGSEGRLLLTEDFITGIVTTEPQNPNLDLNPNSDYQTIDFTVNDKTAYIQSYDGQYGFRIRSTTSANSSIPRYGMVSISLEGLTLVKEADPGRYTLEGFTMDHMMDYREGSAEDLQPKLKYISELTDDDIYTHVTLRDVEIASSTNSYTNVQDGYLLRTEYNTVGRTNPRADCMPLALRDINGSQLNMLFNTKVPWRRGRIPQGSGDVSGILVSSKLERYGYRGDVGRYQIRPQDQSDIDLAWDYSDNFTAKIAEWDYCNNPDYYPVENGTALPHSGSGYLDSSLGSSAMSRTPGFGRHDYTASVSNGSIRWNGQWWNLDRNEGEWVTFNFPTRNVSGTNLALIFTAGAGNQGDTSTNIPLWWDLAYSTDGVSFTDLKTIAVHPIIISASTSLYVPPGLMEYVIDLPDSLFGQDLVTVRMKTASNVCGTLHGEEDDGVITSSNNPSLYFRYSYITVKYNK